ncbi:MAG: hypothetical protein ABIC95_00040 [archaeon]
MEKAKKHIVVMGGYDRKDPQYALLEGPWKYFLDTLKGRDNRTIVLSRATQQLDGRDFDDAKFMMGMLPGVSMGQMAAANTLLPGLGRGSWVGGDVQGQSYDAVMEAVKELNGGSESRYLDDLVFKIEGENIGQNYARGIESLGMEKKDRALTIAADNPFKYNFFPELMSKDFEKYDILLDLNGDANMPKREDGTPLFDRNFYMMIKAILQGKSVPEEIRIKESNLNMGSYDGLERIAAVAPLFYSNRKGTGQAAAVGRLIAKSAKNNPDMAPLFLKALGYIAGFMSGNRNMEQRFALTEEEASRIAEACLSTKDMQVSTKLQARHQDPFAIIDIDGLHDYLIYRAVLEKAYYKDDTPKMENLAEIYPHYELLKKIQEKTREKGIFETLYTDSILNNKVAKFNELFSDFEKNFQTRLDNMYKKKTRTIFGKKKRAAFDEQWKKALNEVNGLTLPDPIVNGKVNFAFFGDKRQEMKKRVDDIYTYMRDAYKPAYEEGLKAWKKAA